MTPNDAIRSIMVWGSAIHAPITRAANNAHLPTPLFGVMSRWTGLGCNEMEPGRLQNDLSEEPRFILSSDDNCFRVRRPRVERLNPAFALQDT
ncbi:hypothetical protein TNCV_4936941 [Trichonephila clavipes]|nr:hypothetical protein TNCV_4936941 [Trichonephila clavipes]